MIAIRTKVRIPIMQGLFKHEGFISIMDCYPNKQIANLSVLMKIYIKQLNFYCEHGNLINSQENTKRNGALLLVNY